MVPKQAVAQKNSGAAGAVAGALAVGAAAAIAAEQYKEQLELRATEYVLKNHDFEDFELSIISLTGGTKAKDQSSVSIQSFYLTDLTTQKRYILFALASRGWANEYGVDYSKIRWEMLSTQDWIEMASTYVKLASGKDVKPEHLMQATIVNKGVKQGNTYVIKFPKLSGDRYLVSDYNDDYKIVFNEKSFGLFIKDTWDLVQMRRATVINVHSFLITGRKNIHY